MVARPALIPPFLFFPTMKSNLTSSLVPLAALAALFAIGTGRVLHAADAPAPTKAAAGTPGNVANGKAVYLRVCFVCHQPTGLGLPGAFPPLAGSSIVTEADPGKIIRIVLHGLQGPVEVKGATYNSIMPPPVPALTDKEIADVLTYVRSEWGNQAAPVTIEAVTAIRAKAPRPTPWTWAELIKQ
jgi:mono/diheme cytochrome c family protein